MPSSRLRGGAAMAMALAAALAVPAAANPSEGEAPSEEPATADANSAVREVRDVIAANYVLADKIPVITAALDEGIASGRYAGLSGGALVDRLNQDLTAAAHDKHLSISFDPARASMMDGPMGDEVNEGPEWERMARSMNHGVAELRLMDGNVRYMNLVGFAWTGERSARVLDNAVGFLGEGDAVVIDLRYNGGGSPKAIEYLFSHFVEPGKPLMTFYMGGGNEPQQHDAIAELPAGRLLGKPLYVLTSRMSISAAEAFAALVKDYGVGEIVGETTAGAAYRNSFFPIAGQYLLSVSVGRGEVGPSRLDWEGTGIAPTIAADAGNALDAAHMSALRKLALDAPQPDRMMMEARATMLGAKLNPEQTAHPLAAYSGQFGDRAITVEGEALFSQRRGGPKTRLLPLGANAFIMETDPTTRVEYAVLDGHASALEVVRANGSRQRHARID
jgi:hypothetical protein